MIFNFLKRKSDQPDEPGKLRQALRKSQEWITGGVRRLFGKEIDEEALEELEALFIQADLGVATSLELCEAVREIYRDRPSVTPDDILYEIGRRLEMILGHQTLTLHRAPHGTPSIYLIVGVNGNGKTTSIAKLANLAKQRGEKVILGAADTFRAAAIQQLETWATRAGVEIVKGQPGSDPSAVVFDTLSAAVARKTDTVLIDTAGRLHTKSDLMEELRKINRVCKKVIPDAPHETLLVLDATTGQNALEQAKIFHEFSPLTGVILTKLDGTAKGGIVVAIQKELNLPVKFVGVGEGMDDLQPFNAHQFIEGLLAEG